MLSALSVRNIVLIDQLDLQLQSGLMVLTGETGAGKSILLDALSLALGARGDQSLVRAGEAQGQVTAVFDLASDHPAIALCQDAELEVDGALILRRVQYADGRTKAFINDQPVSGRLLRQLGELLIEIHGQHDDRALIDVATHRALLDEFGGVEKPVADVMRAHAHLVGLEQALDRQRAEVEQAKKDEAFARHTVEEIGKFSPEVGEEDQLAEQRHRLMQLEKAVDDVRDADEVLHGAQNPTEVVGGLLRSIERKASGEGSLYVSLADRLNESVEALGRATDALEELKRQMDFDPTELSQTEERLFDLRALARKHDVSCDELPKVLARYQRDLEMLEHGSESLDQLEAELAEANSAYHEVAAKLSAKRATAGRKLEKAVDAELPDLKLGSAHFVVALDRDDTRISANGYDQVAFHVQTNPGTAPGPMFKVASGGELSRFLLALKVVLAETGSAPVLIFDEIDSGVGGAVADAMGKRLQRLAGQVQVLAVTHAPQVAARASQHMLIAKGQIGKAKVRTEVTSLDQSARDEEVARMLAGAEITNEARAAAKRLIAEVG